MLKTRVITALALLLVMLPALFYLPQTGWAILMAGVVGVAAWEWGALSRLPERGRLPFGLLVTGLCLLIVVFSPSWLGISSAPEGVQGAFWLLGLSSFFWMVVVPWWLRAKWLPAPWMAGCLGILVLFATWLAVVQLRGVGAGALLAVLAIPWAADIAAYFAGRRFGKRKLAPTISPGKTWEGAVGALIGVVIYGAVLALTLPLPPFSWLLGLLFLVVVTAVSIIGDLLESLMKRQAGIKDSSQILPGHGGVMDRLDSLTSTLPVVAFLWHWMV